MNLGVKKSVASTITLLDRGCEFDGKLSFEGVVRIDGTFRGEIFSQDHLIVGDGAIVEATIQVGILEVGGHFKGSVTARERVIIHPTGKMEGRINSKELEVLRGGVFNGEVDMSSRITQSPAVSDSIVHFKPKSA